MPHFCLPDSPNPERAASKVEQNLQNLEKCSTATPNSARAVPKVEQNLEKLEKCSTATPNSARAALRVEQNHPKLKKCSTTASKIGPRSSESRTKSRKIEKMFYSVTFAKQCGLRLRANLRNQRFARNRGQVQ